MAFVTLRVLEGLERGRVFRDLKTPITIGREDDNNIQLNDERISRFHAKLQDDSGRIILTDLDSTNGTRVNGHPTQMRVLQDGDLVSVGRCLLVFGDVPPARAGSEPLALEDRAQGKTVYLKAADAAHGPSQSAAFDADEPIPLFPHGPPEPPRALRALERAQVSDLMAYLHEQIGLVLRAAVELPAPAGDARRMACDWETWQRLIAVEGDLARYLRQIADPDAD